MHCANSSQLNALSSGGSVALVGHPNVGKSVIFQRLTGQHVAISNYPGTTVEVARGAVRALPDVALVDTPGVITFPPHSEDEQVTERVLLDEPLKAILQVGDAKNLRRTLLLTIQLAEMGLPLVLALNMMDEAKARGVVVDHNILTNRLSCPVVPTTAIRGLGVDELITALKTSPASSFRLDYPQPVEAEVEHFCRQMAGIKMPAINPRALALLWLSGDIVSEHWLQRNIEPDALAEFTSRRQSLQETLGEAPSLTIQRTRLAFVESLSGEAMVDAGTGLQGFSAHLSRLTTHPVWGLFILAIVLYALYAFVGVFGAGLLVDLLETKLFGEVINPVVETWTLRLIPIPFLADLLIGDYGLWTMGMTYAMALILPIVTTFFLAFGIMEDSGYLPRLAALSNRMFQALGLNGKAVLPMVLGLGCVTMATLTTRVLENKRERLLVILLLALAVPCSAQLGVIMGLLAGVSLTASILWGVMVLVVMLAVGWLAARLMPGERTQLLVELPPLRFPLLSNVLLKTLTRLEWYLKEVVPIFLLGTLIMFTLDKTGVLSLLIRVGEPVVVHWLGLPAEASAAFLMGFLRRDFGATGFFVMESQGLLSPSQIVVAMVTITLFIPCIASVMMIAKERSWKTAVGMLALIFPLAFFVGGLLNRGLMLIGWGL